MDPSPLLSVQDLNVSFKNRVDTIHAVRGIDFDVFEGESLGIVGESGCGKTTAMQAIVGLCPKGKVSGSAYFEEKNLIHESKNVLGKKIGMVYQSPLSSLNPTMKIRTQIAEGMIYHGLKTKKEAYQIAIELLSLVGIRNPFEIANHYPHELSGGERQRVAIAIALSCNPKLLIADEPTTALDVTIQAQIIRLLQDIQRKLRMSLIIISHDLGVIGQIADRILVFYGGKIVEQASSKEIFSSPKHPYTQMLLQARPDISHPKSKPLQVIEGSPPSLSEVISGCSFANRCPYKTKICEKEPPFFGSSACWRNR